MSDKIVNPRRFLGGAVGFWGCPSGQKSYIPGKSPGKKEFSPSIQVLLEERSWMPRAPRKGNEPTARIKGGLDVLQKTGRFLLLYVVPFLSFSFFQAFFLLLSLRGRKDGTILPAGQ